MQKAQEKALEITTRIVSSALNGSSQVINGVQGSQVADYFSSIYKTVSSITSTIPD